MERAIQRERALRFAQLHNGPGVLIVGSAWDAGSAVVFERAGFDAIATSSAGVAFSLGYPDGQVISPVEMIAAVARVVRATALPVSADIESGYGGTVATVVDVCREVLEAGAVGINLEDATGNEREPLYPASIQTEKIRAIRAMAESAGIPLVINARTDTYLLGVGRDDTRFRDTVERLNLYRGAGADCLFAPGVVERDLIAALVRELDGPLNLLAVRGTPPIKELAALGVRRISQGSGPARAALRTVQRVAAELKTQGTYDAYTRDAISYEDTNRLFRR